ncbi:hypothetical protein P8917_09200 [Bacillus atrophaeus]|uniref:hypothetical protein n=1 Tax=Bacillus atrophaeus TaxID=1452 RepID=UPI00227E7214|nr:hypothetical protein [Bacillus atrophaeus]MCY8499658.1 hypothetical protein [Bacillus atrophaeus]MCY8815017.1 hypothetical protein [Bacillus atrophaeus]MCY8823067.1 hypothetical protein [Bacillus atrophaeus]MCY8831292.1 hypothetical protein [Bacillus atrophaeus]MCY8834898.1 hypothetical protein [Bacillus atrophaeus]
MHVPDNIMRAIVHSGYYYKHAIESSNKIRDWMEANNINSDFVKDQLIDCIENGTDQWQNFIEFLEDHDEQELYDGSDD